MGREARLRKEKLKAMVLSEVEDWTRPASEEEAALLAEIEQLPIVRVERFNAERLQWMGMEPRQCHVNCDWYERNDPERLAKAIPGWWLQPHGIFMFHSIVLRAGGYICLTPQASNIPEVFDFAPDPKIVRVENAGRVSFLRAGAPLPTMVRRDPERAIKAYTRVKERVLSGMDPIKAGEVEWPD